MARRATLIEQARATAEHILVLDAGASLLYDRDPALINRGSTSIEALNRMGYDAMTLGGLDIAMLTVKEMQQRQAEARFPLLSANATITATGALLAEPYTLINIADHKVAILGLTDPYQDDEVLITDPTAAAKKWVPELRKEADIIIILSHLGLEADEKLASTIAGIDLIVSGGNASMAAPKVVAGTGTVLFHSDYALSGTAGTRIGVAQLQFDAGGTLAAHSWTNTVLDETIASSPEMEAWVTSVVR